MLIYKVGQNVLEMVTEKVLNCSHCEKLFTHKCFVSRYGTGTLTQVFLDRVFQECLTYEGEMVIL